LYQLRPMRHPVWGKNAPGTAWEYLDAVYFTRSSQAMCLIVENDIDLILLDIEMPELNGIELLKSLKAKDPGIPIIMITGYPSVDNIVQSMKLGASHVFVKPPNIIPCAFP